MMRAEWKTSGGGRLGAGVRWQQRSNQRAAVRERGEERREEEKGTASIEGVFRP